MLHSESCLFFFHNCSVDLRPANTQEYSLYIFYISALSFFRNQDEYFYIRMDIITRVTGVCCSSQQIVKTKIYQHCFCPAVFLNFSFTMHLKLLEIVTEELMQRLCTTAQERAGWGRSVTNPVSSSSQCTCAPFRREARQRG